MRALTLTQPWAGLVASGIKLVENRPRKMIEREDFGRWFAIHASREIDEMVYDRIAEIAPWLFQFGGNIDPIRAQPWYRLSRITSAVIAVAKLGGEIIKGSGDGPPLVKLREGGLVGLDGDQARWFFGPVGYAFDEVIALPEPIPARGWQGFWKMDATLTSSVLAQAHSAGVGAALLESGAAL